MWCDSGCSWLVSHGHTTVLNAAHPTIFATLVRSRAACCQIPGAQQENVLRSSTLDSTFSQNGCGDQKVAETHNQSIIDNMSWHGQTATPHLIAICKAVLQVAAA